MAKKQRLPKLRWGASGRRRGVLRLGGQKYDREKPYGSEPQDRRPTSRLFSMRTQRTRIGRVEEVLGWIALLIFGFCSVWYLLSF